MISRENLNYAVKNLLARKLRSMFTLISIFIGIATIFIFISFGLGLYQYIDDLSSEIGIDKLIVQVRGIGAPGSSDTFRLEDSDIRTLEKTRGIAEVAGMAFTPVAVKKDDTTKYVYLSSLPVQDRKKLDLSLEVMTVTLLEGRMLNDGEKSRALLGYRYMIENGVFDKPLKIGDKLTINEKSIRVSGFFEELGNPADDANIYVTEDAYKEIIGVDDLNFGIIVARVDDVARIDEIKDRAVRNMRKDRGQEEGKEDFFIQSAEQLIESFSGALNIVIGFIVLIAVISVIVSAINTANTMFTSILERTKEIGVLKAIGAPNREIMYIFLLESSILGFIAGIIGILIGSFLSYVGGEILAVLGYGFLSPAFPWYLFAGCILFATSVGTVSGIIPAYNASKQKPVDSLRYE